MRVTVVCLLVTVLAYLASRELSRRFPSPWTSPVLCSTALIIAILTASGITFPDYGPARSVLTYFLGPATVALAVPAYRKRALLVAHLLPAMVGLVAGVLSTMFVAVTLGRLLNLSALVLRSLSVKSVTTPVAVELARAMNGDPALTAVLVVATGMIGVALGPLILTRAGVRSELARGLALGTISQGMGTAQAALESDLSGAIAGVAMSLAAILTSFVAPRFILLFN